MTVLLIILAVLILLTATATYFYRRNKPEQPEIVTNESSECCGAHTVCEKDSLLSKDAEAIYYNDEELDQLSGISSGSFSKEQLTMLEEVFYTLQENEVAGWIRSLQIRNIELPEYLRDEALLIIRERRFTG